MEPGTAKLAVQLQIADINDLLDGLYDGEDIPNGDARTSFQIMRCDLEQQLQVLDGQVLTLVILRQEHANRLAFSRLMEEERQAASDHQLAMRLTGLAVSNSDIKRCADYEASLCDSTDCDTDEQWDMAKELYASHLESETADRAPLNGIRTVTATATKTTVSKILGSETLTKCCACMEVVPSKNTLTLRCKPEAHTYCRGCLVDLFASSMINTALFPPRCCKMPIPLDTCRVLLPKKLIKDFDLKVEELATPNPTHCSNAECSAFVRTTNIKADVASCVFCKSKTCVRCKSSDHNGLCPSDPHVQLLMDIAKRGKWQQCTKCKNMVELEQGCFHMTCRCQHEFCYLCGVQWKTCSCPKWNEDYLTRPLPDVPAEPLPAPHEHDWQRIRRALCEGCGADFLPYVMRCEGCDTTNCWRCIHNQQ